MKRKSSLRTTALLEMVEAVENYFVATEFEMIETSVDYGPSLPEFEVTSRKFYTWMTNWSGILDRRWLEILEELEKSQAIVEKALPEDKDVRHAFIKMADGFCDVAIPVHRLGYYLGILVGMHSMDATHQQLVEKAERLARFLDAQEKDRLKR